MAIAESGEGSGRKAAPKSKVSPVKVGIIVTGMHRSGTSATTRMLNLLGCDIASDLVVPDQHNPTGYWEAISIAKLNDEMLNSAGFEWHDLQPLSQSWFESPKFAEYQERAIELLSRQVGKSHLFAIKDPRFCRVLPVWTAAVEALGARPVIVSPIRSPSHVATSLLKRNGMNRAVAQLLWLRHAIDAERWSRGFPRAFFNFSSLLSDWRGVADHLSRDLGVIWPRDSVQSASQIDAFINSAKVESNDRASELSPLVLTVYQILSRAEQGGLTPADFEGLDRAREHFDLACSTFSQPLIENQEHGRWLAERLEHKDAQIAELNIQSETLADTIEQVTARNALAIEAAASAAKSASAQALQSRIAEIEAEALAAGLDLPVQTGGVEAAEDPLGHLKSILDQAIVQASDRTKALARLESELDAKTAEVEQARTLLNENVEAQARGDAQRFAELEEALAETSDRVAVAEALARTAQTAKQEAMAELEKATRERTTLEASIEAQRAEAFAKASEAEAAVNAANAARREALAELERSTSERTILRESLDEERRRAEFAVVRMEVLTSDRDRLLAEVQSAAMRLEQAKANLEGQEKQIKDVEAENQALKASLDNARIRSAALEKTIVEANSETVQLKAESDRRQSAEADAKRFRDDALRAEVQLEDALARFAELQREIATRNSTLADYDREAADSRAEARALELSLKELRADLQRADQQLVDSQFKIRLLDSELQEAHATVEARDARVIRLESESRDIRADFEALTDQLDREVAANAALRAALASAQADPVLSGQRLFQENVLRQEMARALKLRNAEFDELARELETARRTSAPDLPSRQEQARLPEPANLADAGAVRVLETKPSARRRLARAFRKWAKRHPGAKKVLNRLSKRFKRRDP